MKTKMLLLGCVIYTPLVFGQFSESVIHLKPKPWGPMIWESKPPAGCPVENSEELVAVMFTGQHADYTYADTWYPSWAADDNLYSPYTDGVSGIWRLSRSNTGKDAVTGQAKIVGDDPMNLKITSLGAFPGSAAPYVGRYPCGSLVHNGIWYYGTYCLDQRPAGYNLGTLGPFVGFRVSTDKGITWQDGPFSCENSLFNESGKDGSVVKIGAPHFVDFGRNMEHSPDGKAYLVGHGAMPNDPEPRPANLSWVSGDQIYLTRVKPTVENINDPSKYEYFCGFGKKNTAIWSYDFSKIKPIFEWNNHTGCVTMTYNAALKKYIMCITDGWPTLKFMDTYFLESDHIEGPWKLITYMENFGEQGYFVNIPTKFISDDGFTSWLSYSGNFAPFTDLKVNPPGGRYGFILQEMKFLARSAYAKYQREDNSLQLKKAIEKWARENPLTGSLNLVRQASVTASSVLSGYSAKAVIDGVVDGFPNNPQYEWASNDQTVNAKIRLSWDKKIKVSKIWLFDRPSHNEHIVAGGINMSDGSTFYLGELPNAQLAGKEISFPSKEIEWIEFVVLGVGRGKNIGLAEIAVFE
ncbi:hypothetical protein QQ020_12920 [Fulvivirgaceae bacterium BMA12]|uniref:DUF7402 domain-containing protein n=1 Tax=Agaribacillus aureus TaxID=3051825 RepID=A0ABT8L9B2_9BACT|nr:hypothetical protein [Fulvivirgaceae bacterium BMA12]